MSQLTIKLRSVPDVRFDISALLPAIQAGANTTTLERLPLAGDGKSLRLGDIATLSGSPGDTLLIEGCSDRIDGVGAGMGGGTLVVEGNVGAKAGLGMKAGRLDIKGSAGSYLASGLKSGIIHVAGPVGDFCGGVAAGHRFGMTGGHVIVDGNIGARAGDKMRRGLILVRGHTGDAAGSRMVGGTIIAEGGFGTNPGQLMRRGTLIGPRTDRMLATFGDCGLHELVILSVMSRAWTRDLGPLAPKPFPRFVRRFAGDLAAIGKGELLLTAA